VLLLEDRYAMKHRSTWQTRQGRVIKDATVQAIGQRGLCKFIYERPRRMRVTLTEISEFTALGVCAALNEAPTTSPHISEDSLALIGAIVS